MRLGIDVGGTNTDAVLLNGNQVLSWSKSPTTQNVTDGIIDVIQTVLTRAGVAVSDVECIMLGTTHFTNAFVERRGLLEVGVIRLGSPASDALLPMTGWPQAMTRKIGQHIYLLPGGYEFDGRDISTFNELEVRKAIRDMRAKGLRSAAISCTFAPINPCMEQRTAQLFAEEAPEIALTLSSAFGRPGFLERENAAIMNASLAAMAKEVVASFTRAFDQLGLSVPFYISQNDGTLISAQYAARFPVFTFGSGPTNSMRGGAFLTGLQDAIVVDIGGTTTDIGALSHGFPRESTMSVDIGGVRTNFRMPDILALGLGGGTRIELAPNQFNSEQLPQQVVIGPESVGYRLSKEALIFGGQELTTSDIAVASGRADFGNKASLPQFSAAVLNGLLAKIDSIMEDGLDRMKMSRDKVPVILVGGGSVIAPSQLKGASEVIRPGHASVANAVGAAIAQVGAEVESIISYDATPREQALATIKQQAVAKAINAGAANDSVKIIDLDEVYLSYMPGNMVQIRVKAVGDLNITVNRRYT
ncbi:MAG: hydantoinase/oxoprolinase family protein [Alteromonadaceae bacterium]|nr:hydantoinase/oxoprolinase family protein [Alteromonadaceae bacterium]